MINTELTSQGRSPCSGLGRTRQDFFLDRSTKCFTEVFMTQALPFFDPKVIALFREYKQTVYQALD
jgi:hypothetical protein